MVAEAFFPVTPHTLEDAQVSLGLAEQLLVKALYVLNGATSSKLSKRLCLPAAPLRAILGELKNRNLVVHRGAGLVTGDFRYDLSEAGRREAELFTRRSAWSASAPVPASQWLESVEKQSIRAESLTMDSLREALSGLEIAPEVLERLGTAVATGHALFLHGKPGNGKTSIAERLTQAFESQVYVPRCVEIEGHLVRVFDPMVHEPVEAGDGPRADPRWVLCKRPTVVAGGELRLSMLELTHNRDLGVSEAPLQLKASGGTLVIDDFGRQQVSPRDLLNRWIVPLERRVDFLALPDGTKWEVPFDPFVVFSTNLDPATLVDEAFLRRIPYKIELPDPSEKSFRRLYGRTARALGLQAGPEDYGYLIETWYADRPMRACHPRDLLTQIRDRARFLGTPMVVTPEAIDEAARTYFVELGLQ